MFDRGVWHAKAMLGGLQPMATAVHDVAGPADLTNSQVTAALVTAAARGYQFRTGACQERTTTTRSGPPLTATPSP